MQLSWDYVAGFTDGEGSVGIIGRGPRVTWGQKDKAQLEALRDFLVSEGFHPNFYFVAPSETNRRPNGIYMMNLSRREEVALFCEYMLSRVVLKQTQCQRVLQWLKDNPRRWHTAELERELIVEYVQEGFTKWQIAQFLGCSEEKIYKVGKRLGIQFHKSGGKIVDGKHAEAMTKAQYLVHRREREKNNQCCECGRFIYPDSTRCHSCALKERHRTKPESFKASSTKSVLDATSLSVAQEEN